MCLWRCPHWPTGWALTPLAERLRELQRSWGVLHADETPVQQLAPGQGKTQRAYLWAYRSHDLEGDPPIVVFDYQTLRAGRHAASFLQGWQGHLLVDDYAGYKALFQWETITELGCMAHARRKFFDLAQASGSPVAHRALRHSARIYRIEAHAADGSIAERQALRARYAQPRLRLFQSWLIQTRLTVPNGSGTAKAIDYTLKRWPALCPMRPPATCRSTTIQSRTSSTPSPWAKRTDCSPAPNGPASERR